MKHIQLFMPIVFSLLLCSCNENGKTIRPVSEKVNGPLGEYFQLVQKDYLVQEGRITLDIMRIKDGWPEPMKTNAPLGYCDECYEPSFMVEFLDKEGRVLAKSFVCYKYAPEQVAKLTELGLNEVGSLSVDVLTQDVCQVKLLSDFVYRGTATSNMSGTVNGTMDILMSLEFTPQGEAKGAYYHRKFGADAMLCLQGTLANQSLVLDEYSSEGKRIGKFQGVFKEGAYTGSYESFDGKTYDFNLTEDRSMYPVDYSGIDFSSFSDELAFAVDNQDYEDFYQAMFESQGILLSVKDTMHLVLNNERHRRAPCL